MLLLLDDNNIIICRQISENRKAESAHKGVASVARNIGYRRAVYTEKLCGKYRNLVALAHNIATTNLMATVGALVCRDTFTGPVRVIMTCPHI